SDWGSVVLWDVQTWTERDIFDAKGLVLMSADLSSDGKRLVAGGHESVAQPATRPEGGRIHVWDVASGGDRQPIRLESAVGGVAFSPNGKYYAAAAALSKIWVSDTGEYVSDFWRGGSTMDDKIRFSP